MAQRKGGGGYNAGQTGAGGGEGKQKTYSGISSQLKEVHIRHLCIGARGSHPKCP